jgi:AP endonuclease 2
MKTSRGALERDTGLPGSYDAFFSFPANKGGYSGVAVYTDSRVVVPLKAEEGLSGNLQPKPPLDPEERISKSYPDPQEISLQPDGEGNVPSHLTTLDSEGRALVLDFGLFILINVYCPNESSDERLVFKMNYNTMLQERLRILIEEGRKVIIIGDINICATPLDHGEGQLASRSSVFYDHPARVWFRKLLEPEGCMVDLVRKFWPDRKGMFTCTPLFFVNLHSPLTIGHPDYCKGWNTKLSARETNYGARIDYILSTPDLLPWIKHGDIQPRVKGSDHCPIFIDLHDEIVLPSGSTLTLREAMKMDDAKREPPRLASKYWDEFSGKQTKLSGFFGKRTDVPPTPTPVVVSPPSFTEPPSKPPLPPVEPHASGSSPPGAPGAPHPTFPLKRKVEVAARSQNTTKKRKPGQAKLSSFFQKSSAPTTETSREVLTQPTICEPEHNSDYSQFDYDTYASSLQSTPDSSSSSKAAWSHLMAPIEPPKCTVHGESTKEFTVNKPGPNRGKKFFICSRCVAR